MFLPPISFLQNADSDANFFFYLLMMMLHCNAAVIMPPSALDRLSRLNVDYPMLFQIQNPSTERVTHCGVHEFVAEEGFIHMPTKVSIYQSCRLATVLG